MDPTTLAEYVKKEICAKQHRIDNEAAKYRRRQQWCARKMANADYTNRCYYLLRIQWAWTTPVASPTRLHCSAKSSET